MVYRTSTLSVFIVCATLMSTSKLSCFEISLPKTGTFFACSIGASSMFIAASYILTQHYKHLSEQATCACPDKKNRKSSTISPYRLPPAEFWWAVATASACIVTLFLFTDDSTPSIQEK